MEAQCTELVGDELQTPELEGLGRENGGGAHDPLRGIAGNSREMKQIVSPWLAAEAVNAQSAPHGRRQTVAAGNGRLQNYLIARLLCA